MFVLNQNPKIASYLFRADDEVPNSRLPLIVCRKIFAVRLEEAQLQVQAHVERNGWRLDWLDKDAVYRFTHYHSTAHEVLAVIDGVAILRFGGKKGIEISAGPGDVFAIPAGLAHQRIRRDDDFTVAGMYPNGQKWDLLKANPHDLKIALENIPNVPLPDADPFYGKNGPLIQYWR